ncbi:Fe(2+) transporter permease subunit FeoB [Pseudorhodobacter wandonensis]|uniref:Fe(2+) transporter permease subunit FeoB n=1 Tax=Pseudorhodobacter wandonensis TaxID=1120568 RepID=UPI00067B5959|nr:Fe(2+) transporter permease subunit FeoB [Pseudorhodobacter wandonensis]
MNAPLTIAIVGNPNCGKTTLFNALTGSHQQIGNWPGVTVEQKTGRLRHGNHAIRLIDLPGVYSLSVTDSGSIDERLARDFILTERPDRIINVLDAANLERNLYLTTQLLEMGAPLIVALNMMDIARLRRIKIDPEALAAQLGCPVVPIVASGKNGLAELRDQMITPPASAPQTTRFSPEIEAALAQLLPEMVTAQGEGSNRWRAIKHLEGDVLRPEMTNASLQAHAATVRAALEADTGVDADTLIACARYDFVANLVAGSVNRLDEVSRPLSDRIDRAILHRLFGIPIFLGVMYLMFMFTINIGGAFIDFFDIAAGTVFVDGAAVLLAQLGAPDWLVTLLAQGVGGGIQTVATFIPIVACLFFALSVLEDSGYMARAAFVMDRFMRMIGLPGKSFVPLIVAFGCNVPAIMATRTLDSERDRVLTVMMAPFMSCGARLPVYALFAAAFFPTGGQNIVFGLYFLGLLAAVGTGLLLKATVLQGKPTPFVMELPPYHLPTLYGLTTRTWHRLRDFLQEAGQVIIVMVAVLAFLNSWGADGSFGNDNGENSVLSEIGQSLTPVFAPMGIEQDNWPATVGIFTGILAKEAVVGTLNTLYGGASEVDGSAFSLIDGFKEAAATIGPNLHDAMGMAGDPLGLNLGDIRDAEIAAEAQGVQTTTFGSMAARFDGQAGAFAYLLMILLYMPCVAAMGAIWRETGWKWASFASLWTMGLAYGSAVVFYQAATFARHPVSSLWWISGMLGALGLVALALHGVGQRRRAQLMTGV